MILRFLFYVFLFYLAYKLVFDFALPLYRTTRRIKKGFRDMNERMQQHTEQYQKNTSDAPKTQATKPGGGDYIDFEEVK
jgi:membrane-anchored glycerophosphoryl diester phosphodiesterase (GDPDase)